MPLPRLSSVQRHAIGSLSRWVTIFQPGARASDGGASPPDPNFSTWASISALGGSELDKAQQIAQEVEHLITIPYQTGIRNDAQVKFENRMFLVKFIEDEDENHVFLDLYCCEIGQNAGSQP